jgi:hypothetical protein
MYHMWQNWVNGLLGLWLIWLSFSYSAQGVGSTALLVTAIIIAVLAFWSAAQERSGKELRRPA